MHRDTARPDGPVVVLAWTRRPARQHDLARALGAVPVVLSPRSDRRWTAPLRYAQAAWRTTRTLQQLDPSAVVVTNPPVPAAGVAARHCRRSGAVLVLDSHPGGFGAQGDRISARLQPLHARAARQAAAVLVTTERWEPIVHDWGSTAIELHEPPTTGETSLPLPPEGAPSVLFVCVFAPDEPVDDVLGAARLLPHVHFAITGDPAHVERSGLHASALAPDALPGNVTLTGLLPRDDFEQAMADAHVVLTLTTEPSSVMRGACEAVDALRPLVISAHPALVHRFPHATPTGPGADALARAITEAIARYDEPEVLRRDLLRARDERRSVWEQQLDRLQAVLRREPVRA